MKKQHGTQAQVVMGVWPATHHFGWLALHLMHAVMDRLGIVDHATNVRLTLEQHLRAAATAYFKESMENKEAHYLFWTGTGLSQSGSA
jgi:hypothetical protein